MNPTGFYDQRNGREAAKTNLLNALDGVFGQRNRREAVKRIYLMNLTGFLVKEIGGSQPNEST